MDFTTNFLTVSTAVYGIISINNSLCVTAV